MYIFRFILLFVTLSISKFSAADAALPIEVYGALPDVSMMVISPSGEKIAYRRTDQDNDYMMIYNLVDKKLLGAVDLSNIKPSYLYFIDEKRLIIVVNRNTRLWGYRGRHEVSSAYSYLITHKVQPYVNTYSA